MLHGFQLIHDRSICQADEILKSPEWLAYGLSGSRLQGFGLPEKGCEFRLEGWASSSLESVWARKCLCACHVKALRFRSPKARPTAGQETAAKCSGQATRKCWVGLGLRV